MNGQVYPVEKLDEMTKEYLDNNFMLNFIKLGAAGLKNSFEKSIEKKRAALLKTKAFKEYILSVNEFDKGECYHLVKELISDVKGAIDYLSIHKRSVEYSFGISILHEFDRYFMGVKKNPGAVRKYERNLAKYNSLIARGKNPTWKVIPPSLVDLELTKENIVKILENLIENYEQELANVSSSFSKLFKTKST